MTTESETLIEKCENLQKEGKYKEIIHLLTDEILDTHKNVTLFAWVAYSYSALSNQKKAIEYYTKAIKLNDTYTIAYNNRGIAYKLLEEKQKAIEDYGKAIEIDKNYDTSFRNRGNLYFEMEKYELAIFDFEKALAINYDENSFLETKLEQAKENLLLHGLSKKKKEIKVLRNIMENNVQAI